MRPRPMTLALGLPILALVALASAATRRPARGSPPEKITFMQTLEHWKYPGVDRLRDASMADGGFPGIASVKCRALQATPDPFGKVADFYEARARSFGDDAKAVYSQDDSEGRPLRLRTILIQRAETSTTLVISRAEGEGETHIAWSHYLRIPPRP